MAQIQLKAPTNINVSTNDFVGSLKRHYGSMLNIADMTSESGIKMPCSKWITPSIDDWLNSMWHI